MSESKLWASVWCALYRFPAFGPRCVLDSPIEWYFDDR